MTNGWWLGILFLVLGGPGLVGKIIEGRRTRRFLDRENLKEELSESWRREQKLSLVNQHLDTMNDHLLTFHQLSPEMRARLKGPDPYPLLDLLRRVQAADAVYPQLPLELRSDIDTMLNSIAGDEG